MKIISKKDKTVCCVSGCNKDRISKNKFCSKHRHQYRKEVDLIGYTYGLLRTNARRRGKIFEITKDDFREFCEETHYLELKGKTAESASIDRIRQHERYVKGNLQVLTLRDNSIKGTEEICPF